MTTKASPPELRKVLEIAQTFVKHGILFVPVPVLDPEDRVRLLVEMYDRLKTIEAQCRES